jgi:multiple sugar transport system ATP-binding protein
VTKRFADGTIAVDEFSLDIQDEEFMVIVGPSGCGKTTALRMLAGLEEISDGEIRIDGEAINHVPPERRDIAMVFQSYALYPHMSVAQNLAFGLRMRKENKALIKERVGEAARVLGLEALLSRKPRQLSGGQRQRVALGRAIVRHPRVFLLDEPLSNLDAELRAQTRVELMKLHQRLAATFVYVTHDQVEAMTMGTRIAVMRNGTLQQVAAPKDLYAHPANMYVAGFVGSPKISFVRASMDGTTAVAGGLRIPLPKLPAAREVTLGIRPEHLTVGGASESIPIDVGVDIVEVLGAEQIVYGKAGDSSVTARLDPATPIAAGDRLTLRVDPKNVLVFDTATEAALN